jgi:glycosyltransferase involved in cell wall biosynthesis
LESIVGLDYPEDRYELIVVDNGSLDGSSGEIASFLERSTIRRKVIS